MTDYAGKLTTAHYGTITAREPREEGTREEGVAKCVRFLPSSQRAGLVDSTLLVDSPLIKSWGDWGLFWSPQIIKEAIHFPVIFGGSRTVMVPAGDCYPPLWIVGRLKKFQPLRVRNGTVRIAVTLQ